MQTVKAHVQNGRLVLDEPTDLPEGLELDLVVADDWDDLTDEERKKLHAAIARSIAQLEAGQGIPADQVLKELTDTV